MARIYKGLQERGVADMEATLQVEVFATVRWGSGSPRPWCHDFGKLFTFDSTYADVNEPRLERYVQSLGSRIMDAAQHVEVSAA